MEDKTITFEALPQATSELQAEVRELKETLDVFMKKVLEIKPENPNELVGIDEACKILGLKKPTLYHKVQKKEIKSYKPAGCKMIMFKRSDLMDWIEHGGKTSSASLAAIEAQLQGCIRHKPKGFFCFIRLSEMPFFAVLFLRCRSPFNHFAAMPRVGFRRPTKWLNLHRIFQRRLNHYLIGSISMIVVMSVAGYNNLP